MRLAFLASLLSSTLAFAQSPPPPPPPNADLELAKAHFNTGQLYYERGRYPDAAREFEEAYRLSNRPELLYNMGKSYDGIGDHARALAAYRRFLAAVTVSADRPAVTARVEQLAQLVGVVTVKASVEGSQVTVDGAVVGTTPLADALELNPGTHKLTVVREGYATWRGDVVASPGQAQTVTCLQVSLVKVIRVEVPTEKKVPIYKRWYLWTAIGVVVVGGVVAGAVVGSQQPPVSGPFAVLPRVQ
jgi:hypothetical protein